MAEMLVHLDRVMDNIINDNTNDDLAREAYRNFVILENMYSNSSRFFSKSFPGDNAESEIAKVMGEDIKRVHEYLVKILIAISARIVMYYTE